MTFSAADLSVVIPTRARWHILRRTLGALAEQGAQGFETVVVADGTDQEVPSLEGVRVLRQEHAGPGAARNLAVAETARPLLLFMGDDMIPAPGFIGAHLARHAALPADEVAVLGRIEWHPEVPRDGLHRWLDWSGALFDYRLIESQGAEEVGWPRFYSSNVSLKRRLFDAAGGFDRDFFFDYEDLDFGYRLGQQGLRLLYEPGALTRHLHPYDWAAVERRYRSRAAAEQLMAAKHADWFSPWFRGKIEAAMSERRASRAWPLAVDHAPRRPAAIRRAVERRADRYYLQRLAPGFRAAWSEASRTR